MSLINIPLDKDSYMNLTHPDTNYGDTLIKMGVELTGEQKSMTARAIGNFDVSILSGKTINISFLY